MAAPHDLAFAGAAVKQRMLTSEQVNLGTKSQKVLADLGISKSLAVIAVEAGWMELGAAFTIVTGLRKLGVEHPEVKPREASDADESVLERLSPAMRKRLEAASRTLASLFYARGAGTLALDQGSPTPAPRAVRKPADPTPTPAPARRLKPPVVEIAAPPPKKSGALGAIVAVVAAVAAIVALLVTRKGPPKVEPEPPPVTVNRPPPPPKTPPPPTPKEAAPPPEDSDPESKPPEAATDPAVEARRKLYIEQQEKDAATLFEDIKQLVATKMTASARQKIKRLMSSYGWTEFVKLRKDEIGRLLKTAEEEGATAAEEGMDPAPMPGVDEPPLPAMATALKRMDDGAAADARRAAAAKKVLAGAKADLALRGGKVVKGAEVVDVSREDLRVRGEIDGAKVDLLLSWSALEAAPFLSIQKQVTKGQAAAGLFELGRACLQRRLWKDAKAAFDECAKLDAAWKPRLPDIAAVMADPAILRGAARRLGDGRLLVEYSFAESEQAGDFAPLAGAAGTASVAAGALKLAGKETALFSLKDVVFSGDVDVFFQFEGPGEAAVGFGPPGEGQRAVLFFGAALKLEASQAPAFAPAASGTPVKIERRGASLRVRQGDRLLGAATVAGGAGPRKLFFGARGEASIKDLWIVGAVDDGEMARRVGPFERLEGGAHAGDFNLEPVAAVAESNARAVLAEDALEAGQLEEAWGLVEDAAVKAPASGLAVAVRGLIRLAQGEMRLAMADADLALALDPCRGEVTVRARRILAALRGPAALGAHRRLEAGSWDVGTDASEERLNFYAGKLDEASKRYGETLKESGTVPKGIRAAVFSSRDAYFLHLETSDGRDPAVVDGPGAELEFIRLAARAYVRAAAPASPPWFEEGMAAHLAGENRAAEMKELLAQAAPLDALLKKSPAEFTETERIQSASFVRFLLAGAHKGIISEILNKLRHGVPANEAFSGKSVPKFDAEWRAWAAADK